MTNIHKAAREALIDTDGENLAVRAFLALYGTSTPTAEGMAAHLRMSGFDVAPAWVKDSPGHLTKSGAQDWLRRLFALEEAPGEEREAFEAWYQRALLEEPVHRDRKERQWSAWQARAMLAARPEAPTQPIGQVIDANRGANTGAAPVTPMVVWFGQPAVGTHLYARPEAPTVALTEEQADCELPPLPSPATRTDFHHDGYGLPAYTADQMHVHAALAAAIERERCARICEQSDDEGEGPDSWGWHAKDYAKAIRKEGGA